MATFILTWNPDQWHLDHRVYDEFVDATARGATLQKENWSVGGRRGGVAWGDRAFLLRQHRDRGIVASGHLTSGIYQGPHWDGSGRLANYADVEWDTWLAPADRLPVEQLKRHLPQTAWDRLQASGVQLPEVVARGVEELWEPHLEALGRVTTWLPDEVPRSEAYPEGAASRVLVNRYERDPRARAACLERYGHDCMVCGFNFAHAYGSLGDAYIHVHHLKELSTLGPHYQVDPLRDLRPVCPNCHAMLHQRRPALSIEQLRRRLRTPRSAASRSR